MINKQILKFVNDNKEELLKIRRYLHMNPELSDEEYKTQEYIINFLKENDIEFKISATTGIMAYIKNGNGKNLAFRADMDALPITEENDLDYKSKNDGVMHACGHDVHMAVHLLLLKILKNNKKLWNGTVNVFFQPAEETVGGAKRMILEGVCEGVDRIVAFHCAPEITAGKIGIKYGKLHATSAVFKLEVIGKETHAALAYKGIDSIVIAAKLVDYLQTIVSRRIDARDLALITVGTFNAGVKENIVASNAILTGTIRTLTLETREFIKNIFKNELISFVESFGAKLKVEIIDSYSPVINNDEVTKFLEENARDILGFENVEYITETRMDVEDMGYFLEAIPGSFYRLGVGTKEHKELHTKDFVVDEYSLLQGLKVELKIALEYLCIK